MLRFSPKDKFLMNFCCGNLNSFAGEAKLRANGSFMEKVQFELVKRRVRSMLAEVSTAMFRDKKFEVELIIDSLAIPKKDLWDTALVIVIVRYLASLPTEKATAGSAEKVSRVLSLYLAFIEAERPTSMEVLDLKIQIIRVKCAYDLDIAAMRYRRSVQ